MTTIHAYAATSAGGALEPFEFDAGPLGGGEVEIEVEHCGVCHSDLSMLDNEWRFTPYPLVPGHEVIGRIAALGEQVDQLKVGQRVGLGWISHSCLQCRDCLGGDQNHCATKTQTIIGRHGGFADRARCQATWAIPLPEKLPAQVAGPLFCGGVTVFNAITESDIRPTHRVGVVGIGGLGHLALQFLNKWGCEVTAFTSSESKADEARALGAHHVVNSRSSDELHKIGNTLDFILSTVNVELDWGAYLNTLRPRGRLQTVGIIGAPLSLVSFQLVSAQRSIGGNPVGSPATTADMLDFCTRHKIVPTTEHFPMSQANDAMQHLRSGKARYRVVLDRT